MILKNSFLANMLENLKRRKGIAVLYSVSFLLIYPIGLTLFFVSMKDYISQNYSDYRESLTEIFTQYMGMNVPTAAFTTLLAVMCAVQGFSYLFKKQKLDMYMSVPVSKERRFAVIYLNGILLYALPYLFSILLSFGVGAGNGVYAGEVIKTLIFSYLSFLLYYLAVYNITIIAVMLTGNILMAFCGAGVFLFYEGGIRVILASMSSMYFRTYSVYTDDSWYENFFSPVLFFVGRLCHDLSGQNIPYLLEEFGFILVKIAVITVITGITGYLLYTVRPAESCNKAITFSKVRPFIKIAILVPLSLVAGIIFYSITNNTAMTILGFILGILLCHGILEVIFEFDLKAMFRSFYSMAAGAVLVFAIYAVFQFDLIGYDRWVPRPDQVESVAFGSSDLSYNSMYDLKSGDYIENIEYVLQHMKITDTESFCAWMEDVAEKWEEWDKLKEHEPERILWSTVKYQMKNGREKYRRVGIFYEEFIEELDALVSDKEYQKGTYQILDEEFMDQVLIEQMSFSNGIAEKEIEEADMEMVLQAYKEDLMNYDIKTAVEQYPIGIIDLRFSVEVTFGDDPYNKKRRNIYYTLPIYANFEKTKAYAEEKGMLADWKESIYDIESITISRFDGEFGDWGEQVFKEKEEIEAVLPALVPGIIGNYKVFKDGNYFNYSAEMSYVIQDDEVFYESNYFTVEEDLLPDFAK